jgi:hypothetical protein
MPRVTTDILLEATYQDAWRGVPKDGAASCKRRNRLTEVNGRRKDT